MISKDSRRKPSASNTTLQDDAVESAAKKVGVADIALKEIPEAAELIWWEKTVEYLFALTNLSGYKLICPLAGNFERAGDVIGRTDARWFLIEFKRFGPNAKDTKGKLIGVEIVKFKGSETSIKKARKHGKEMKPFHNIVYGEAQEGEKKLGLKAHDYWDASNDRSPAEILLTDEYTCDGIEFYKYVELFMKAKGSKPGDKGDSDKGGSGGDGSGNSGSGPKPLPDGGGQGELKKQVDDLAFTNVLAITTDAHVFCCPIRNFYSLLACSVDDGGKPDGQDGGGDVSPLKPDNNNDSGALFDMMVDPLNIEMPHSDVTEPEPFWVHETEIG
ncbi:hypothetical protein [Massilia aquatica]|uniref:Uncharacterized protein n=1 Tax=Massilia aquatica TaxID=2609000 RepID=A0ABX0MD88_9BURK|nr:hypothetical protein [Massilia aquatica]NHZ42903.1 hypothetical protein [Massilia aquatica]